MAEEVGQTDAAPAEAPASAPEAAPASSGAQPFYSYGDKSWATADDLTKHLDEERETGRRERLNMRDYAVRLEQIKGRNDKHEAAVKQFREEQQRLSPLRERYERLDQVMRQRPDVAQYIKQMLGEAPSAAVVSEREGTARDQLRAEIMEELKPVIDAHQEREHQDKHEAMLAEVFADESMPHGTDEAKVREELERISDSPDIGREVALILARQHAYAEGQAEANGNGTDGGGAPAVPRTLPRKGSGANLQTDDRARFDGMTIDQIAEIAIAESKAS